MEWAGGKSTAKVQAVQVQAQAQAQVQNEKMTDSPIFFILHGPPNPFALLTPILLHQHPLSILSS